jgi:hypothetical protein
LPHSAQSPPAGGNPAKPPVVLYPTTQAADVGIPRM